jgi:hypothetical protein
MKDRLPRFVSDESGGHRKLSHRWLHLRGDHRGAANTIGITVNVRFFQTVAWALGSAP